MLKQLKQAPRYIPVAEYEIGVYHYGHKEPYRTVTVCADSLEVALKTGRSLLEPSIIEHIVHVSTRPNPAHIKYMKQLREEG